MGLEVKGCVNQFQLFTFQKASSRADRLHAVIHGDCARSNQTAGWNNSGGTSSAASCHYALDVQTAEHLTSVHAEQSQKQPCWNKAYRCQLVLTAELCFSHLSAVFLALYPPFERPVSSLWLLTSIYFFPSRRLRLQSSRERRPYPRVSEVLFEVKVQPATFYHQLLLQLFPWFSIDSHLLAPVKTVREKKEKKGRQERRQWIDASLTPPSPCKNGDWSDAFWMKVNEHFWFTTSKRH